MQRSVLLVESLGSRGGQLRILERRRRQSNGACEEADGSHARPHERTRAQQTPTGRRQAQPPHAPAHVVRRDTGTPTQAEAHRQARVSVFVRPASRNGDTHTHMHTHAAARTRSLALAGTRTRIRTRARARADGERGRRGHTGSLSVRTPKGPCAAGRTRLSRSATRNADAGAATPPKMFEALADRSGDAGANPPSGAAAAWTWPEVSGDAGGGRGLPSSLHTLTVPAHATQSGRTHAGSRSHTRTQTHAHTQARTRTRTHEHARTRTKINTHARERRRACRHRCTTTAAWSAGTLRGP